MDNLIDSKLLSYIPKKHRGHIIILRREYSYISFALKWDDGFSRSRVADNITELKEMIEELEADRNADF